ncbi:MAG: B12-binding domain-containing radical SAM protein [Burkholderiales bacterium]|nr:B12-binding domain-containing radical SAM protein [Burkholderiales bacterium]
MELVKIKLPASWRLRRDTAAPAAEPRLNVAFSFYAPEGAQLAMPLAVLNGLVKQRFPKVERSLVAINKTLPEAEHSPAWFAGRIAQLKPDVLAFSCMSPHWRELRAYIDAAKQASPTTKILVGGYQAILTPDETIAHPSVDMICIGDGEQPFSDLLERMLAGRGDVSTAVEAITGLWVKRPDGTVNKGERYLNENLCDFPFPDYSLFERNGTLRGLGISVFGPQDKFILPAMTGRGCPYKCTYCSNTTLLEMYKGEGGYIRKYEIDKLIDELARLKASYAVEYFEFWDELFMVDVKYAVKFFKEYERAIGLPFSINARVERMSPDFCQTARSAGCHTIWFGIESGSERYREQRLGRKMKNADILWAAQNARDVGIQRLTFNIIGMPFETLADAEETLALNEAIAPEFFHFFTYIPLEGTPLYEVARREQLLIPKDNVSSDYLAGRRLHGYRLNIREHAGGMTPDEFRDIGNRMEAFQLRNNRLAL